MWNVLWDYWTRTEVIKPEWSFNRCVITHTKPITTLFKIKGQQPNWTLAVNHRHLLSTAKHSVALFVPASRWHIKWPDKGRPWATSDKVSGLWKLLSAQVQCNRRPKWPDNHISTNLSQGQTNAHRVWMRQVAFSAITLHFFNQLMTNIFIYRQRGL